MYLEVTAVRLWSLLAVVLPLSSIAAGVPASMWTAVCALCAQLRPKGQCLGTPCVHPLADRQQALQTGQLRSLCNFDIFSYNA